jgi:hypothetical protein
MVLFVVALTRLIPQSAQAAKAAVIAIALVLGAVGMANLFSYHIKLAAASLRAFVGNGGLAALGIAALCIVGWPLARHFGTVTGVFEQLLAVASPVACVPIAGAVRVLLQRRRSAEFAEKTPARPAATPKGAPYRVVLMIFDELDQRVAFDDRPDGLTLPFLDSLCDKSLVATRAPSMSLHGDLHSCDSDGSARG